MSTYRTNPRDPGPHSPRCLARKHAHGAECSPSCPTCGGSVFVEDEQTEGESQPTRRARLNVLTTTGHFLRGDWSDWTEEGLRNTRQILKDFGDLKNLSIADRQNEGILTETHFNPKYVVSVTLEIEDEEKD